jgi:hypothetical protein
VNGRADGGDPQRIRIPLRACLRFGLVVMATAVSVVIVVGEIKRWIGGLALSDPLDLLQLGALAIVLGLPIGLFCYAVMLPWAWTVGTDGVTGRGYWGRRHRIAWDEVARVTATSFSGVPAIAIGAAGTRREVIAYTLGVDLQAIHSGLVRHAGADHPLTRAFAGAS